MVILELLIFFALLAILWVLEDIRNHLKDINANANYDSQTLINIYEILRG